MRCDICGAKVKNTKAKNACEELHRTTNDIFYEGYINKRNTEYELRKASSNKKQKKLGDWK